MLSKFIREKLKRFLSGEKTEEGQDLFEKWYNSFSEEDGTDYFIDNDQDAERRLNQIHERIKEAESNVIQIVKPKKYPVWQAVAASFSLLIVSGVVIWMGFGSSTTKVETGYGETKTVTLPDQSIVILNANSSLLYKKEWQSEEPREVYLEGEAFFEVKKSTSGQKFLVKSDNNLVVEVLGTAFSVTQRDSEYRVVLTSGKVRLKHLDEEKTETVTLEPGELVSFKQETNQFEKQTINPELYTSWRNNKFLFENTSMREVIKLLEETYGVHVEVKEESLYQRKISGSIPSHNLNNLLFGLSELFELEIERNEQQVIIKERNK